METTASLPGIAAVIDGAEAAQRFEMPPDREGDFVVLADARTVIGSRYAEHDLSGLAGHRLRSHGGLNEQRVPFILSRALNMDYQLIAKSRRLRNFHIFEFALNGTE
jgi:phosphonoacetate hydrolase